MKYQLALLALATAFATPADAALESRLNGQAVYDTDRNITWIANAQISAFETFGFPQNTKYDYYSLSSPTLTYGSALRYIDLMNQANYLGFSDWRLPTTAVPDDSCTADTYGNPGNGYGFECTGSEMGHLFYEELGGTRDTRYFAGSPTPDRPPLSSSHNGQYDLFSVPFAEDISYWSSSHQDSWHPYAFSFDTGYQISSEADNFTELWFIAVRDGDVTAVPEPATYGMLIAGLAMVGFAARKQSARDRSKEDQGSRRKIRGRV